MSEKTLIGLIILIFDFKGSHIYIKMIYCLIKMDKKRQNKKRKKFLLLNMEVNMSEKQMNKGK
jgi:hypothetical protein